MFPASDVNAGPAYIYAVMITQYTAGGILVDTARNMLSLALSVSR